MPPIVEERQMRLEQVQNVNDSNVVVVLYVASLYQTCLINLKIKYHMKTKAFLCLFVQCNEEGKNQAHTKKIIGLFFSFLFLSRRRILQRRSLFFKALPITTDRQRKRAGENSIVVNEFQSKVTVHSALLQTIVVP